MACALPTSKDVDDHLDAEFVFLAQFIRPSIRFVAPTDRPVCIAWLKRLLHAPVDGTPKDVRNVYLAELLLAMQSGCIGGPFADFPPEEGALSSVFSRRVQSGEPAWLDTIVNGPYPETVDADERTYIATQAHPDGRSMYAYVAVSTADEAHWLNEEKNDGSIRRFQPEESRTLVGHCPKDDTTPIADCESCSRVNHTQECMKLPCATSCRFKQDASGSNITVDSTRSQSSLFADEENKPLVNFYTELLALVDCFLRTGCCADDEYISQLVERLKEQSADPTLLDMPPDELRSNLLRRLKTRLLVLREQAKGGESFPRDSSTPHSDRETPEDGPPEPDLCIDEELWESAARRGLSATNMMLLESVYPCVLVDRFVHALIRERCALISRMRSEHEVLVSSLRTDLERDVKESLERYRGARESWVLLLKATQEMEDSRRQEVVGSDREASVRETVRELQDAMVALDEEGARGTTLVDQLLGEHRRLNMTERDGAHRTQSLLADNDALRLQLQVLRSQEAAQRRRIQDFEKQIKLSIER